MTGASECNLFHPLLLLALCPARYRPPSLVASYYNCKGFKRGCINRAVLAFRWAMLSPAAFFVVAFFSCFLTYSLTVGSRHFSHHIPYIQRFVSRLASIWIFPFKLEHFFMYVPLVMFLIAIFPFIHSIEQTRGGKYSYELKRNKLHDNKKTTYSTTQNTLSMRAYSSELDGRRRVEKPQPVRSINCAHPMGIQICWGLS